MTDTTKQQLVYQIDGLLERIPRELSRNLGDELRELLEPLRSQLNHDQPRWGDILDTIGSLQHIVHDTYLDDTQLGQDAVDLSVVASTYAGTRFVRPELKRSIGIVRAALRASPNNQCDNERQELLAQLERLAYILRDGKIPPTEADRIASCAGRYLSDEDQEFALLLGNSESKRLLSVLTRIVLLATRRQ